MSKGYIYKLLSQLPTAKVAGQNEIRMRCFICGDSKKDPNKKRLYFKIDPLNPNEPILYHCFNCMSSGILTVEQLHDLNIYDKTATQFLSRLNKNAVNNDGSYVGKYGNTQEIKSKLPELTRDAKTMQKIDYIKYRLGDIPIERDIEKLKIIPNLLDFLNINNFRPANNHVYELDKNYIGFLSVKNEYVILRDITGMASRRYVKYNIHNMTSNADSFYSPRASIDLLSSDDIAINVAEGPFDILSIMYNVYDGNLDNQVFAASCNASFKHALMYYIKKGLVGDNIKIKCWRDTDISPDFVGLRHKMIQFTPNFNIYYNALSKDFGVKKDQIHTEEYIL